MGQITVIRVPDGSWRKKRKGGTQLPLALGHLEPYMHEGALPPQWQQLMLPFSDTR